MSRKLYNKESVSEIAAQFKTRSEFALAVSGAYNYAKRMGILDEVCAHMQAKPQPWTRERAARVAKQFKTRTEFNKHAKAAYSFAYRKGILDEICGHMTLVQHAYKYSDQQLREEAQKYRRRIDFQNGSKQLYKAALNRGLLDQICAHMTARHTWDIRTVKELAKPYKKRNDFAQANRGAHKWASMHGVLDQVCAHMPVRSRGKWTKQAVLALARQCGTRVNLERKSKAAINAALSDGYWHEVLDLFPDSGWYPEAIFEEARKYKTRSEFAKGSIGAYRAAIRLGLEDKACDHMEWKINHYSDEELAKLAKQYKTRTDFVYEYPGAANAARNRGIWEKICEHMGPVKSGFREDKPAVLYLLVDHYISRVNVGITGRFKHRLATHNLNDRADYQVLRLVEFTEGETPRAAERLILEGLREQGIEPLDGTREEFSDAHLFTVQSLFDEVVDAALV